MTGRAFNTFVVAFWLISMSWLLAAKVIPPLLGGDPPDFDAALKSPDDSTASWRLRWKGEMIGFAVTRVVPKPNGEADLRTVVKLEDLELEALLDELLGMMAPMVKPLLRTGRDFKLDVMIATRMGFDRERRFKDFHTTVDLGDTKDFLTVRGQVVDGNVLELVASMDQGGGTPYELVRDEVTLPQEILIESTLAPRSQLKDLRVGQTWTIPVYQSFPPNAPVQIVQAEVEKLDVIIWDAEDTETYKIVYRGDAGSGINASRAPFSTEWVKPDGQVIRQEVTFSGFELMFDRTPDEQTDLYTPFHAEISQRLWD